MLATVTGRISNPYLGVWTVCLTDESRRDTYAKAYQVRIDPIPCGIHMPFILGLAEQYPKISTPELDWHRGHAVEIRYSVSLCTDGNLYWLNADCKYCDWLRDRTRVGSRNTPTYRILLGYARSPKLKDPFLSQARRCPVLSLSQPHDQHQPTPRAS